jgi:hypothetical protein
MQVETEADVREEVSRISAGLLPDQVDALWAATVNHRAPTDPALVVPYKLLVALIDETGRASAARKKRAVAT